MASAGACGGTAAVARTGYQGFGSFFSDNVEDMIAVPRGAYVPPERPFAAPSMERAASLPLGEPCRELFMIDFKRWAFINHGAFGAVCRAAHEESNQWREHCEAQPLRCLDRELFPQMVRVMREVADFIGADPRDLVFVPNATTGLNVAIQAAGLRPGDTLYMLNIGYGSVKKMAQAASAAAAGRGAGTAPADSGGDAGGGGGEAAGGINVVYGEVTFPISGPQAIVDLVAATLPPGTRLAVFDTVTSNTALLLPVRQLTALCRSRGVQVLIDGAHALGQVHLDLRRGVCGGPEPQGGDQAGEEEAEEEAEAELQAAADRHAGAATASTSAPAAGAAHVDGDDDDALCTPDYFVTNCHKWLCAPRGSALLWVAPGRKACVRPLVVSHGSGCGFTSDFIWDGMRDYAPYLATSSALALWRALGPARIRRHARRLLRQAVALLGGRWGGGTLAPSLDMCGAMALVGLPQGLAQSEPATSTDAKYVQDLLHAVHAVEVPVKCVQGRLYARISVHIYNTLDDYSRLAVAVDAILQAAAVAAAPGPVTHGAEAAA